MKYIKKFNESDNWVGYDEMSKKEYVDWINSHDSIDMNSILSEVKEIKDIFNIRFDISSQYVSNHTDLRLTNLFHGGNLSARGIDIVDSSYIYIIKFIDNWYTISIRNRYFLCDGIDGIKELYKVIRELFVDVPRKTNESNSSESNDYYQKIDIHGLLSLISGRNFTKIPFSPKEESILKEESLKLKSVYTTFKEMVIIRKDDDFALHIVKGKDEWFYLEFCKKKEFANEWQRQQMNPITLCYKCDQIDGLLKFLNDKL